MPERSRYRDRLRVGLCGVCGVNPRVAETSKCSLCHAAIVEFQAKRVKSRRAKRLCVRCGDPAGKRSLCQRHLDAAAAYQRSYTVPRRPEVKG